MFVTSSSGCNLGKEVMYIHDMFDFLTITEPDTKNPVSQALITLPCFLWRGNGPPHLRQADNMLSGRGFSITERLCEPYVSQCPR